MGDSRIFPNIFAAACCLVAVPALAAADDTLPYAAPGPFPVMTAGPVEISVRGPGEPAMNVRILHPDGPGPFPLIVYSHGTFSSNEKFDPIVTHWASWGYVVLLPNHIDANRGWIPSGIEGGEKLVRSRATDMTLILDALEEIESRAPAIAGKLEPPPWVAAGHSMGTYPAMLVAGLETRNPQTDAVTSMPDPRYGAVVLSSDPGNMAMMPSDVWLGAVTPLLVMTSPEDIGLMGDGRINAPYQTEVLSGGETSPGRRYRLVIEDADHYFGGLVQREPSGATPDHEALEIFNAVSTTFLEAWAKDDPDARARLDTLELSALTDGRADIEIR